MWLIVVMLVLAIVFGGLGLLMEGLLWLLVIGAALLAAGLLVGILGWSRT